MAKLQKEIDIKATATEEAAKALADTLFEKFRYMPVSDDFTLRVQWALWDKTFTWCGPGCYSVCMNMIFRYGLLEGQRRAKERYTHKKGRRGLVSCQIGESGGRG